MSTGQQRAVWSLLRSHHRTLFIECISCFFKNSSENHCQTSAFMENLPKSEVDLNSELSELLAFKTFLQASLISLSFISFPLYSPALLSFLLFSSPLVSLSLLPLPIIPFFSTSVPCLSILPSTPLFTRLLLSPWALCVLPCPEDVFSPTWSDRTMAH